MKLYAWSGEKEQDPFQRGAPDADNQMPLMN